MDFVSKKFFLIVVNPVMMGSVWSVLSIFLSMRLLSVKQWLLQLKIAKFTQIKPLVNTVSPITLSKIIFVLLWKPKLKIVNIMEKMEPLVISVLKDLSYILTKSFVYF